MAGLVAWWGEFWGGMGPPGAWVPNAELNRDGKGSEWRDKWGERDHVGEYHVELEYVGPGLRDALDWVWGVFSTWLHSWVVGYPYLSII